MTVYEELRDAIAAVLETIPNIGIVHARERFVVDTSKYLDLFKWTDDDGVQQIRAWMVLRENAVFVPDAAFGSVRRRHTFILYGVLGFQDSTDTYGTLQTLVDLVLAAFDSEVDLGVSGVTVGNVGPVGLRAFRNEQFGSVLAHACEIILPIDVMGTI